MFIHLDKNRMHVQVIAGILEKYEPSEKVLEIHQKLESLKADMEKFMQDVVSPRLTEVDEMVKEENKKFGPEQAQ